MEATSREIRILYMSLPRRHIRVSWRSSHATLPEFWPTWAPATFLNVPRMRGFRAVFVRFSANILLTSVGLLYDPVQAQPLYQRVYHGRPRMQCCISARSGFALFVSGKVVLAGCRILRLLLTLSGDIPPWYVPWMRLRSRPYLCTLHSGRSQSQGRKAI